MDSVNNNVNNNTGDFTRMTYDDVNNRFAVFCRDYSVLMFCLLNSPPVVVIKDSGLQNQVITCCLFAPSRSLIPSRANRTEQALLSFNVRRQLFGLFPVSHEVSAASTGPESMETEEEVEQVKGTVTFM